MANYAKVQNAAGEWVAPAYGIGYGQKGGGGGQHFATLAEAEAAFDAYIVELLPCFNHPPIVTELPAMGGDNPWLRSVRVQSTLKNGKPGQIVHRVNLYRIDW